MVALALVVTVVAVPLPVRPAFALEADGLTIETAIVIDESNTVDGIAAEYAYLRRVFPGWRRTMQALVRRGDRRYDVLTIVSSSNEKKQIYFDITLFFGRM